MLLALSPKVETFEILDAAIRDKYIASAKALCTNPNKTFLSYSNWASLMLQTGVKVPNERLRDALRAVLIDSAGPANICMFLNSALRTEEPVALVVFEHKPELLFEKLQDEDPLDLAASSGQANDIPLFIRLTREEERRHLTKWDPSGGGESPLCSTSS
ncbi:MAG: hypothetical protein Q9161_009261, partial [Pseudevernia consocians]